MREREIAKKGSVFQASKIYIFLSISKLEGIFHSNRWTSESLKASYNLGQKRPANEMFNVQKRKYVSMQGAPNIESLNKPLQVIKLFNYLALAELSLT